MTCCDALLESGKTRRVLFISTVPETIWYFLFPFSDALRKRGFFVAAAARDMESCERSKPHFDCLHNIRWNRNPSQLGNLIHGIADVRRLVREGEYDVVHVHSPIASFVTRFALRKWRAAGLVRVYYTAHGFHFFEGNHPLKNFCFRALEKRAAAWTDKLIVINKEDEQAAKSFGTITHERIVFTPGIGVDISQYGKGATSDARARVRQELGIPMDAKTVLVLAELTPRKRPQDFLNALVFLADLNVHAILAGTGVWHQKMQALARKLGVGARAHFVGFRNDVPDLFKAADVFCLLSRQEGLPRCIMECMAAGVPVVGTRIRGTSDLLAHDCGILVDVGDVRGAAEALRRTLTDAALAHRLISNAKQHVQKYDFQNVWGYYNQLYAAAQVS